MRRLVGANELLDGPLDRHILAANLRDLARINRWLGGSDISWRALRPLVEGAQRDRLFRVLDVGTGAADIPVALARRADKAGMTIEICATDIRPEIVAAAQRRVTRSGARSVEVRLGSTDPI